LETLKRHQKFVGFGPIDDQVAKHSRRLHYADSIRHPGDNETLSDCLTLYSNDADGVLITLKMDLAAKDNLSPG